MLNRHDWVCWMRSSSCHCNDTKIVDLGCLHYLRLSGSIAAPAIGSS